MKWKDILKLIYLKFFDGFDVKLYAPYITPTNVAIDVSLYH